MILSRRLFRFSVPLASLLIAYGFLQGCLFSSGGLGGSGEKPPGSGTPQGSDSSHGGNPPGGGNPDSGSPSGGGTSPTGRGYYAIEIAAGSNRLKLDSVYTVRWRASDSAGHVPLRLSVFRNDSFMTTIMSSVHFDGSMDWRAGGYNVGSGTGYTLRLVNESDTSQWDSSSRFSIYSDYYGSVVLTAPAAGARIEGDSILRVAWTASGKVGETVGFELYRDTGLVWAQFDPVPVAAGQFSWPILEWLPSGSDYRFRIITSPDRSLGQMGPAFTYVAPVRVGGYAFLRPRADAVARAGDTITVEAKVTGNPGSYSFLSLWRDSPRELVWGWTPGGTHDFASQWTLPENLVSGTYRFRLNSLADTTLFAFSEPFTVQGSNSP